MKNRSTAIALSFFLGGFGIHKFYLGKPGLGILYALFFWTFIPAFVAFGEMIFYLCIGDKGFNERYNKV